MVGAPGQVTSAPCCPHNAAESSLRPLAFRAQRVKLLLCGHHVRLEGRGYSGDENLELLILDGGHQRGGHGVDDGLVKIDLLLQERAIAALP